MGYTSLVCTTPFATAYDEAYPTRSTENYAHALHTALEDMKDAGWTLQDGMAGTADTNVYAPYMRANVQNVFNYAKQAIVNHRASVPTGLTQPAWQDVSWGLNTHSYPWLKKALFANANQCIQMMYKIYYMWETEEDPLLLKEKLTELLLNWPLTDTEIILQEEGGQSLRVHPAWKNVDI